MKLPEQVQKSFDTVDAMSIRERTLIAVVVLALLWALWDGALMRPLKAVEAAENDRLASLSQQVRDLNASIQQLAAAQVADPDAENRHRLTELQAANREMTEALRELTIDLVDPKEMAPLLESMLTRVGTLQLVGMRTLQGEAILADGAPTGYYRHGLAVEVRGGYLDALRYLQALERIGLRFFWESVDIEVSQHPSSDITIVIYTLGRQPGVIGV